MAMVNARHLSRMKQGRHALRYGDGRPWQQGVLVDGHMHGRWTIYDELGRRRSEGDYVFGMRVGRWCFWSEKGRLVCECNYEKGRPRRDLTAA